MPYEIEITAEYDGVKPKNFLKKKLDLHYNKLFKHIKDKRITLNKKKIKEDSILRKGDIIKVWLDEIKLREVVKNFKEKKNLGIETIFENDDLLVLNKLSGITVQGAQEIETSLSLHLAYLQNKNKDEQDFEYFHVHRLDKDTSGALVIAKNKVALRELNSVFRTRSVKKIYHAICIGEFKDKKGDIDVLLQRNEQGSKEKMSVIKKQSQDSKRSISKYNVLKEFEVGDETFSLVEIEIKTGLMHQIRVHMKYLGHPILGDTMYGNSYLNKEFSEDVQRQLLHAKKIEFEFNKEKILVEAPYTKDFEDFLKG